MLPNELTTSRLLAESERPLVTAAPPRAPSRFRSIYVFAKVCQILASLLFLRLSGRLTAGRFGALVRPHLEKMGALWIKAGKILALRKDLLPPGFAEELEKLTDHEFFFPFALAKSAVEEDLGAPLEHHFDQFRETPFASTTMAQIHEAHLRRENVWVAVKIQHPHAKRTYVVDLSLIRNVALLFERLSLLPQMRWSDLCWELEQSMRAEIDFRFEAAALGKLGRNAGKNGVYYPEVFPEYSNERILVMEFIRGALVSDLIRLRQSDPARLDAWLAANRIDPRRVAKRLFQTVFREILEDNFFHADLHPGNVILLHNSRIAFIDCRSSGSLEAEQVTKLRLLVRSLAEGEHAAAADYFFLLAARLPAVDVAEVKAGMIRVMRAWQTDVHVRDVPYEQKSMIRLAGELNRLTLLSGFSVQWSLSKMIGALANLDASVSCLWPEMNYLNQLRRYFRKAELRDFRSEFRDLNARLARSAAAAVDLPRRFSESMLFQQILARRQAQVIQESASRIGMFLSAMLTLAAFALLAGEILLFLAFLAQHSRVPVRRVIGSQIFRTLDALPHMTVLLWLLTLAVVLVIQRAAARFGSRLAQPQVRVRGANSTVAA